MVDDASNRAAAITECLSGIYWVTLRLGILNVVATRFEPFDTPESPYLARKAVKSLN